MPKKLVDANLIIRFLLNDNLVQAESVKKLFQTKNDLVLTDLTMAEVVWVLKSVYKFSKEEIVLKLKNLLSSQSLICNSHLLEESLNTFNRYNISFADAYLVACCKISKYTAIYSFDQGLDKVKEIKRVEP